MLAILTTHPIQYQVPLWQALAKDGTVPFEVWYLSDHGTRPSHDQQFGKSFAWDLDMLAGYPYRFLRVNKQPQLNRFDKLRLDESLVKLFKEKGVSALWIQGWQVLAYWQAVWQAHQAGIPVFLRGESNDLPPTPLGKKLIKRLVLSQLFHRIDYFLYIGKANRRLYESYGIRPEQLYPAPYCVDNQRFAQQADALRSQRQAIRESWHIPENAFCVLFAGKFIPKKRPLDLIAAVQDARIKTLNRPVHLLFVGSGELGNKLRSACRVVFDAESKSVSSQDNSLPTASFAGFLNQTEISQAYVAADCLVLPSDYGETWGLVVNEALASGLPSVVSDACGCSEDLISTINSHFCFNMGKPTTLASSLLSVINQSYSHTDLQSQLSNFSISTSVDTIRKVYQFTAK